MKTKKPIKKSNNPKYAFMTPAKAKEVRWKKIKYTLLIIAISIIFLVFFAKFPLNGKEVGFLEWLDVFIKSLRTLSFK